MGVATEDFAHTPKGPRFAGRSGNGFAASTSEALCALIAVIDSQRARRPPEERFERRGRPCRHNVRAGGRDRAGFMNGARGR